MKPMKLQIKCLGNMQVFSSSFVHFFELRFLLALRPMTLSFPAMANFLYSALPITTFKSGHFGVVCQTSSL